MWYSPNNSLSMAKTNESYSDRFAWLRTRSLSVKNVKWSESALASSKVVESCFSFRSKSCFSAPALGGLSCPPSPSLVLPPVNKKRYFKGTLSRTKRETGKGGEGHRRHRPWKLPWNHETLLNISSRFVCSEFYRLPLKVPRAYTRMSSEFSIRLKLGGK